MSNFRWSDQSSGFIKTDQSTLEYFCCGPSPQDAPTFILLHEGLGCVKLWREFPHQLAERTGMGVFVFSRKGYGKSSPVSLPRPLDYMSREATQELPMVLDAIGLERGVLLGHSDGATISAVYAGSIEDFRIRGLILMAPHFFAEPIGLNAIRKAKENYVKSDLREKLARYHDDPDMAFNGWCNAWLDPDFMEWDVSDVIDYFRIPVLAIQGTDDQYGTLAQIETIEANIYSPLDTLILEDCGHAPHLEAADKTLSAIAEYAERLQRLETEKVEISQ